MNSCKKCSLSNDFNCEYCFFHQIYPRSIDKLENTQEKYDLFLIPDLLLIVFEYSGYENYKIFNHLDPVHLSIDLLKQKILALDNIMYEKLTKLIIDSGKQLCLGDSIIAWTHLNIKTVVKEYNSIGFYVNLPANLNIYVFFPYVGIDWIPKRRYNSVRVVQQFYSNLVEIHKLYDRLSNFWKLIYLILKKAENYL